MSSTCPPARRPRPTHTNTTSFEHGTAVVFTGRASRPHTLSLTVLTAVTPYAKNALDGTRIYFEDEGGQGPPVLFHGGILDDVDLLRRSPIGQAVPRDEFRRIYVDHRGLGRSDKPHDPALYAMPVRVADAVAVLDALGLDKAHFIGTSWGGRLGFGIGEHAPERVLTLIVGGQQPYAIDPDGPLTRAVGEGIAASRMDGMEAFVRALETFSDIRFPEDQRVRYLTNDPRPIEAAWCAVMNEGAVSSDLSTWRLRCLIFVGAGDVDFYDQAKRAADEIPNAEFISLANHDHIGAHLQHDQVLPVILGTLRGQNSSSRRGGGVQSFSPSL